MKTGILCLLLAFFLTGCGGGSIDLNSLVGEYQMKDKGKLIDFLKVEKKGDQFYITDYNDYKKKWKTLGKVKVIEKSHLEILANQKIKVKFAGLGDKNIGIFRMPKGWGTDGFKTKSGYWTVSLFGPIELYKK